VTDHDGTAVKSPRFPEVGPVNPPAVLDALMRAYPYLFHPTVVVGGGAIVCILAEWSGQAAGRSALYRRIGTFLGAGALAMVPTILYFAVTRGGVYRATKSTVWQMDAVVAGGVLIAAATTWFAWRRFEWGGLVPGYVATLALVTVPYVAISPFWNVSGHVIWATVPTLYVTLVDRSFWPALAVPIVMVPNRVYLEMHTWAQSIVGLCLAGGLVFVAVWLRGRPAGSGA
jgi:hypothetical protein